MIETTIGVSPPRIELNSFSEENKKIDAKEKNDDFSSYLEKSLESKEQSKKDLSDSGGIQKKKDESEDLVINKEKLQNEVVDEEGKEDKEESKKISVNPEMILMNMVSLESASKIPNSEVSLDSLDSEQQVELQSSISNIPSEAISESSKPIDMEAGVATSAMDNLLSNAQDPVVLHEQLTTTIDPAVVAPMEFKNSVQPEASVLSSIQDDHLYTESDSGLAQIEQAGESPLLQTAQPQVEIIVEADVPENMPKQQNVDPSGHGTEEFSDVDPQVLETLNREQLFKKWDGLSQQATKKEATSDLTQKADQVMSPLAVSSLSTKEESLDWSENSQEDKGDNKAVEQAETANIMSEVPQQNHSMKDVRAVYDVALDAQPVDKTSQPHSLDSDSNLAEIMNQAQYLVKKGGGEVTVKMTPEGMGEVQLKLMLENGKMNLQMNTQDRHVQKMIEDNLSDLKTSLASRQITMEHVTINDRMNSVQKANSENSSQQSSFENFSRDQQQAKSSWNQGQFSENNKRQLFEERSSSDVLDRDVVSTVKEVKRAVGQRVYQANKAQTLNAVA